MNSRRFRPTPLAGGPFTSLGYVSMSSYAVFRGFSCPFQLNKNLAERVGFIFCGKIHLWLQLCRRHAAKTRLSNPRLTHCSINGGTGGIRTHAPFRTNGFQDRLVMTASIPFRVLPDKQDLLYSIRRLMSTLFCEYLKRNCPELLLRANGVYPFSFFPPFLFPEAGKREVLPDEQRTLDEHAVGREQRVLLVLSLISGRRS